MTFEDFLRLLDHIYVKCEKASIPNHPTARDMFEMIDIKQDGVIDFYEWRQSFNLEKFNSREDFLFGK